MRLWGAGCCLVLLLGLVACGEVGEVSRPGVVSPPPATSVPATKEKNDMASLQVELDIFSGRPNPFWNLTPAETADFNTRIAALTPSATGNIPDNLGYRGFVIKAPDGTNLRFKVYNTALRREENGKIIYYTDPNRELEKWLLKTAQQHLDSALYETVKTQIFN